MCVLVYQTDFSAWNLYDELHAVWSEQTFYMFQIDSGFKQADPSF
jgi:hypothetical protein